MGKTIHFFSENTRYQPSHKTVLRKWITDCLSNEGFEAGTINIIFCNDDFLYDMNVKYLSHHTLTDIITFSYSENPKITVGDIYISIERARENAGIYRVRLYNEVCRLIIHGILHLAGYSDKEPGEKTVMTSKEDYYLSLLPN
ncbi:MAG: rRNA maturation RNase YbeY [Bacteroidetes bacterium]|nr:rRNA maturation RNase YbeY [Bacteroidota bacterium]